MKRKLISRNKALITIKLLRLKAANNRAQIFDPNRVTWETISRSKVRGQRSHLQRLSRQQRMNRRQLKKLRKKQAELGTTRNKYGGICRVKLKPALAIEVVRSNERRC